MRKTILTLMALALMVVSYQSLALGASTTTSRSAGIHFAGAPRCDLRFSYRGMTPGSTGRLQFSENGHSYVALFQINSQSGGLRFRLHPIIGRPMGMVEVSFQIAVQGMNRVLVDTVMVNCDCEPGGGGGGGGGGTGNNNGTSTASAASAVSSSPGFAG
jgi:hypothetical protein